MNKNDPQWKQLQTALLAGLKEGEVAIPHLLLKHYRRMKLSELEVMLLIHLIAFLENEKKEFPTLEELQSRMTASPEAAIAALQKLLKDNFVAIDEEIDALSGIQYERYNLNPLYEKLAACCLEEHASEWTRASSQGKAGAGAQGKDIFSIFEKEFARPLTPMELESISGWLDRDQYREELILAALKEAVFAGKVHFRYIDRILLEWSRNRVSTVEQAKEYAQRFRGSR